MLIAFNLISTSCGSFLFVQGDLSETANHLNLADCMGRNVIAKWSVYALPL